MGKARSRPGKDDTPEAEEAAHEPEPKRRRKKKELTPLPGPLGQIAEERGLTTADHLLPQLSSPTGDDLTKGPPFEPGSQLVAEPTFVGRVRPNGPRPRAPGEAGSVFTSVSGGFKLTEDGQERAFRFRDDLPPSEDEKAALRDIGMDYRPGRKMWAAPATPEVRERSDELALRMSGKRDRIEEDRAR